MEPLDGWSGDVPGAQMCVHSCGCQVSVVDVCLSVRMLVVSGGNKPHQLWLMINKWGSVVLVSVPVLVTVSVPVCVHPYPVLLLGRVCVGEWCFASGFCCEIYFHNNPSWIVVNCM